MIKFILVPTDFSKNAERALDYAITIAVKEKSAIILLHAFHIMYLNPDYAMNYEAEQIDLMMRDTNRKLELLVKKIISNNLECKVINQQGLAVDLILETIRKRKPQLVVMGTRGSGSLSEKILGSNTSKVIDKTICPVIAVPQKAALNVIRNITYATDYKTCDVPALKKLIRIAKLFNAKVTLVHYTDGEFTQISEAEYLYKFKIEVRSKIIYKNIKYEIINGRDFSTAMEKHIKQVKPDLLAMSTHHRTSLFDKLFYASETKRMVYHTKIPLMIFHHKQKPIVTYF